MIGVALVEPLTSIVSAPSRASLRRLLDELESLIVIVRTDVYLGPTDNRGRTIGQTVATSLSRIESLMAGASSNAVTYVQPAQAVAGDPVAGLRKIRALKAAMRAWPRQPLDTVVRVEHSTWPLEDADVAWSTLAGELAFVVSETIEAERSIASLLARLGLDAPIGFGSLPLPALPTRASHQSVVRC